MSYNPCISVLLPVYNGEKHLKEAIDSILNQTYKDFELIILDDCSTDNTANIIKSYEDDRIVYIYNEKNLRIAASLNKGISLARGKYIARMDADDIALPERFQKQYEILEHFPDIDIVNIRFNIMSENGENIRNYKYNISPSSDALKYLIYIDRFICHPGVMIRAKWYHNFKYNTNDSFYNIEDCDLWIRMISNGAICHTIKEPLLHYRINSQSVTHIKSGKEKQIINIINLYTQSLEEHLNFNLNINSLNLIKGNINIEDLSYVKQFIYDLKRFEDIIKNIETSKSILKEIHNWAEYCKFRTCISIMKSNFNISQKFYAIFLLFTNLIKSFPIIITEYTNLSK